jgi:hypothetical protein
MAPDHLQELISLTPLTMSNTGPKIYAFTLVETTQREVAVKADSPKAALAQAREHYSRGHWIALPRESFAHLLDENGHTLHELAAY